MGSGAGTMSPPKTSEDGARILINVAVKDIKDTTGMFFENKSADSKEEGFPVSWPDENVHPATLNL